MLALVATPALATPPILAVAGAQAISGATATGVGIGGEATGIGTGGEGGSATGIGTGGNSGANSSGSVTNESGDSRSLGVALGQAPTALSVEGVCGKGTKFVFGVLEWSDYSSKCFNYQIAIVAAQKGNWELANQWVERADGM